MINIFRTIKDKLNKIFLKDDKDEKIIIEFGDINTHMCTNVVGKNDNSYIPKLDYEGEVAFKIKPNNRVSPKRRYITLHEAERLAKK